MTWTSFTVAYASVALLAVILCRRLFRRRWGHLARTLIFCTLLLLLGDAIAEQRGLWLIPQPAGVVFIDLPVENLLVVVATLLNSLLPYLLLKDRSSRSTDRGPQPARQ